VVDFGKRGFIAAGEAKLSLALQACARSTKPEAQAKVRTANNHYCTQN